MRKNLLSIPEVAKELGLSRIAVYNQVKSGKIPARKVGRNYAISRKCVDKIVAKTTAPSDKVWLNKAVTRVMDEYGSVIRWLSKE